MKAHAEGSPLGGEILTLLLDGELLGAEKPSPLWMGDCLQQAPTEAQLTEWRDKLRIPYPLALDRRDAKSLSAWFRQRSPSLHPCAVVERYELIDLERREVVATWVPDPGFESPPIDTAIAALRFAVGIYDSAPDGGM